MRIKYNRTCQRSIKIVSVEKTFALHKSAQKKHFFLEFLLKKALDDLYLIIWKLQIRKMIFFTLDDTLSQYKGWNVFRPLKQNTPIPYFLLLYGWVCFRHAIGQFSVRNLLYGPKFLKKMLISEL